jgi:hypothetical protein
LTVNIVPQSEERLPHLEILPVTNLLEHEWHDDQRTDPLMVRIEQSGVMRNPPIVSPLLDGSQRFMVLDGANRVAALKLLNYPDALVQVVHPDDPGLKLYNWNHVIWGMGSSQFVADLEQLKDVYLVSGEDERPNLWKECGIAVIQVARGDLYSVCTEIEGLENRVELLNAIVDLYKDRASLDRTNEWSVVRLKAVYPDLCGLVIFPKFEVKDVLVLAGQGCLLPTGITRFMVSPRVLHLNYPLEAIKANLPLEEKNAQLQEFIHQRMADKNVRYYAEATYLFDE